MDWLKILFARSGTLAAPPFWYAAVAIYVAALAAQALLAGGIAARASIAPFALAQFACLWAWNAIHTKRLRDAGHATWPVVLITSLFAVLLLIVLVLLALFLAVQAGKPTEGGAYENAIAFYLLIAIGAVLFGVLDPSGVTPIVLALLIIMFGPGLLAIGFTIWTGTRAPVATVLAPAGAPP